MVTLLVAVASCATAHGTVSKISHNVVYYVSPAGSGKNGLSWATAWRDTSSIDWPVMQPGALVILDGGTSTCSASPYDFASAQPNPGVTCGQRYSPFSVERDDITIERSSAAGHNGTVVIDGGRDTPLPYCGQKQYAAATQINSGINLNGHTGVIINGMKRSGIVVRGAREGVMMGSGGHDTLINMEIFDNGYAISNSWGYSTDGNGVLMGGKGNDYDRLLIHDNGQDEFHSDAAGYDESGSTVANSWMGALRVNPGYPGEPFNDLQASGHDPGCTHADGMQIFAPGITMSSLTFNYDVFGPGTNQGLYPSDRGTGTTFDDVTIENSLFLDVAGAGINTDNRVHGWNLSHDTLFATQGGFQIPSNGVNTMTSVIKYGGYFAAWGGSWVASGNVWYGGDPLPGAVHRDPSFLSVPTGRLPAFSEILAARLIPTPATAGSPMHSWSDLLARIDSLDKS
jgi:hypothetical protein